MRVVFVGASALTVMAAKQLLEGGHEVVVIDRSAETIESLQEILDCGLITGDGSRPEVLAEVGPEQTDFLFCLSDSDEVNILGALVGRSLGFAQVVPKLQDPTLEPICTELGLDKVFAPDRAGATHILDLVKGRDDPRISTVLRSGLRFFSFTVSAADASSIEALDLPKGVRAVAITRGNESSFAEQDTRLETGDEVVLLTTESRVDGLQKRFSSEQGAG